MPAPADIATRLNHTLTDNSAAGVGYQVEAQPISERNSIVSDKSSIMADQLAQALTGGTKLAQQTTDNQNAADTTQGAIDADAGITKPGASPAYTAAQDHVHALASWAVDGDRIGTQLQQQGFQNNPDAKQGLVDMNNWLDQQYQGMYAGSSASTNATLGPKMAELRVNANAWFQQQQRAAMDAKQQGDLHTIAGSAFAKAFVPTVDPTTGQPFVDSKGQPIGGGSFAASVFDYAGLNSNYQSLYPGTQGNQLLLSSLANLAITKGSPELLTGMPDSWADGTPTPKGSGDPRTIEQFRQAVKQAELQKTMFLDHAQSVTNDDQKAAVRGAEVSMMNGVLSGKDQTAALHAYATLPGADPSFIEKAANWQHERYQQGQADQVDNNGATASLLSDIALGKVKTGAQIMTAVQNAGLGNKAAAAMVSKGLSTLADVQKTNADDPEAKAYASDLDKRYAPSVDKITGKFDNPAAVQQHADVLLDFNRQRANGTDANTAWQNVQKTHGDPLELANEAKAQRNLAPVNDNERAKIVAGGDSKAFDASGITAADLRRMQNSGQITSDAATKAAMLILARHNK